MHRIMQNLQQIRTISQQLQASERQNAQMLAQQNGMAGMAQTETHAAQQLGQIIQLCNQTEQEAQQQAAMQPQSVQPQNMQHQGMQPQGIQNTMNQAMRPMQQSYQQQSYPGVSQVMQADHQAQQQNQQHNQPYGQMAQVMQADRQNQQQNQPYAQMAQPQRASYANYSQPQHMQPTYTSRPGFTPGLSQVMQADRTDQQGATQTNYNFPQH
jgi:hypothetical protein